MPQVVSTLSAAIRKLRATMRNSPEAGIVLMTTLLLLTLLMAVGTGGLGLSRTDLFVSHNLLTATKALWIARAGSEIGKNWLERNLPATPLPVTLGPAALEDGTYTVSLAALGNGAYRLTSIGQGLEESRRVVEEIVRLPDFAPVGVVTSDGDGLHPDFDDTSGGVGRRIPDFTIDGRNHAHDGTLSNLCADVSPFATTQVAAQNDLVTGLNTLKREIVTRANSFCQADGSNAGGTCTPGLSWVRGNSVLPRFTSGLCIASDPTCYLNLNLTAVALRATALPPTANLPAAPENRGPLGPVTGPLPFVRALNASEQTRLRTALDDIAQRITELPDEKVLRITASLTAGSHTYGEWNEPKVTRVEDAPGELEVSGGAMITGAGVLLIPRGIHLKDATLNWQGLVLIVEDGDLRVEDPTACGQVLGAVVVRDDPTPDRKLDLDKVERSGGCSPLTINYSCEAVTRALTVLMKTVSWTEKVGL